MVVPADWTFRKSTRQESTILFDGVNDFVDLGNQATLWSKSLTKFSFAFWIYPTIFDATDRIVVQHGGIVAQSFRCYMSNAAGNTIIFQIRNAVNGAIEASSENALFLNQWNFVVCVYDNSLGSANLKIYVNGVIGGNAADLTEAINLSAIMILADSTTDFKGNMKNFKWWDGTALSEQQVTDLMNGKRSLVTTPTYWLPMNEGSGSPIDKIGGILTATLTNGAAHNTMSNAPTSLGGDPNLTGAGLISQTSENNIYSTAWRPDIMGGSTRYRIIYIRYIGTDSPVKDCSFIKFMDTSAGVTKVEWAFDPQAHKYKYAPFQFFDGIDDFVSQAHSSSLNLQQFSASAWFRTSKDYTIAAIDGTIVSKGGVGGEAPGENQNYGIRVFKDTNEIRAGFETSTGVDHEPSSSPIKVNDGFWHHVVVTNDDIVVRLYLDGPQVKQHTYGPGDVPENNSNPLVIGKNSSDDSRYFEGEIDEVYVWNNDLTAQEVLDMYNDGTIPQVDNIVYENKFGADDGSLVGQNLINENEEPAGSPVWHDIENDIPSPANIGDFKTNTIIPILLKYTIEPASNELSIENDTSIFRVHYGIQPTQGGGGGEGGGTPPAANEDLVIVFNSDWGEESQTTTMVNHAKSLNPDMVITGGDNAYASSISGFLSKVKSIDDNQGSSTRLEVSIGNHDDEGSKINALKAHFGYSTTHHNHTIGNVFILNLDSENSPTGSTQVDFGKAELAAARSSNTIDWIIVVFHTPIYTAESNHDADEAGMRTTWMPIFQQYKVDLVLCGHNHNVQRTYPIVNKSANNPTIKDSGAGPYANWLGIIQVINGTGGHDKGSGLYDIDNSPSFNAFQDDNTNMNLKIATTNNGKTLTCSFIEPDGEIRHSWVMTRG